MTVHALTSKVEQDQFYSTNELAEDAGVTPRTVRFYESKGLLQPQLAGSTRVYTYRDRARLALILRGKRLGFSLDEISEYLDLYTVDPDQVSQVDMVRRKARERADELRAKKRDIENAIAELEQIEREAAEHLKAKGVVADTSVPPLRPVDTAITPKKGTDS